jgi:hypothetical protein
MGAQEQNMPGMVASPDWQSRPDLDLDAGLPVARRNSVVHVPPRAILQSATDAGAMARKACALEMFGFLGYLGIGHIYLGHRGRGVLLMMAWWVVMAIVIPPFIRNLSLMSFLFFLVLLSVGPSLSCYWIQKELGQEIGRGRR